MKSQAKVKTQKRIKGVLHSEPKQYGSPLQIVGTFIGNIRRTFHYNDKPIKQV
jgi:hypothetical protein